MSTPSTAPSGVFHLRRALEIDLGIIAVSLVSIVLAFQTGDAPRWHNIVFPPIAFALALLTLRMAWAEIKEMRPLDVHTTAHHTGAMVGAGVAAFVAFLAIPVILFMPFVFLGGVF
jgi:hypothetical protein